MTAIVYWASLEKEWMLAKEPEPVSKIFYEKNLHNSKNKNAQLNYCPSFNENLKNLYALRSIYDYSFKIENDQVQSKKRDQHFFNQHVNIRDLNRRLFSLTQGFIFFTEENGPQQPRTGPPRIHSPVLKPNAVRSPECKHCLGNLCNSRLG